MRQDGQFIELNRSEFLSWLMNQNITRKITHIQNHHTWSPNYSNGDDSIQLSKDMKNYHVNTEGWADIGQNLTIVKSGLICVGRPLNVMPAGILGHNEGGICIENVGNFDIGGDIMTSEHAHTIAFVNAALLIKFNLPINLDTVVYHTWFGYISPANIKTCPGTNFFDGNTSQHAINNFYPLIAQEIKNIQQMLNPQPQIQPWQVDVMNFLQATSFITSVHNPNEPVSLALFAYMMNNHFSKLQSIDPIIYLTNNNFIKDPHIASQPVTWSLLGYMLIRRKNTNIPDPIAFLSNLGYITSPKDPNAILTISLLGAVLKNAITKNLGI